MDTSVLLRERSQQSLAEASGMAMSTVTRPVDLGVHQATSEVTEGQAVTRTQFSLEASATQSPVSHGKVKRKQQMENMSAAHSNVNYNDHGLYQNVQGDVYKTTYW